MARISCTDVVSERGEHAVNEDFVGYTDEWAWVLDGASGVGSAPWIDKESDARWLVLELDSALRAVAPNVGSPEDLLRTSIGRVRSAIPESKGRLLPNASAAIVHVTEVGVDFVCLGDVSVVGWSRKHGIVVGANGVSLPFEESSVAQMANLQASGVPFEEAQRRVLDNTLNFRRQKMNRAGGYWTVSASPQAVDHALKGQLRGVEEVFLMTDGFRRYDQLYGIRDTIAEAIDDFRVLGLQACLASIRRIEEADPHCRRYPRIRKSDDATAVRLELQTLPAI